MLHIVPAATHAATPIPEEPAYRPDESGVRRLPTALDIEDLTDEAVELRVTIPPPVPSRIAYLSRVSHTRVSAPPSAPEDRVDIELVMRSCPPPPPRYFDPDDAELRWSVDADAREASRTARALPDPEFDRELRMHGAVLFGGVLLGAMIALL